jgi:hypothetical protein
MNFEVTPEQHEKINHWLKQVVYPQLIEEQRKSIDWSQNPIAPACWDEGHPYEGAIGGGLTYEFTPTSIGISFWVSYGDSHRLDLTDYDSW